MIDYDAVVIGGGHAGIEASLALSREGYSTLLITQSLDAIGRLSCNPAIGGLAKGNLVREIDALGGEMARLIDSTMIQYRILNRRRGPAVQAPRAQADKFSYSRLAKETLEREKNLHVFMDEVVDIISEGRKALGVLTKRGNEIRSSVVVLTTGTFMRGKIFIGEYEANEGRLSEEAANDLGWNLEKKGFPIGRLKTGTPARVRLSSLDLSRMEVEKGDEKMRPFSFDYDEVERPNLDCYITYTNEETHKIIRENINSSPLYGGKIVGKGPRYCPSIEDKVIRFPERERHQIFVEPEGVESQEMYLNGLSSSLPEHVQEAFIHTLPGLERAEVMRPGYAVEYDYLDPLYLYPSLESKMMENLFVAGQTNGTSGYEEAASQGLVAGINAARKIRGESALVLKRSESYIGVLIDDLTTKGTKEPYRMFTSRAEYRLLLRHDTADQRLTRLGAEYGLVGKEKLERLEEKLKRIDDVKVLLKAGRMEGKSLYDLLKEPERHISSFSIDEKDEILDEVEMEVKYEGYIKREEKEIGKFLKYEDVTIPPSLDYNKIVGLSAESREKFSSVRPLTLGQAMRISGVRVSDYAILALAVKENRESEWVALFRAWKARTGR